MSRHITVTRLTLCVVVLASMGCTNIQLRRNTVGQMSTVHELQQQQVLDNLAMFVHNRDAYPYFSVVSQGTSTLQDTGTLDVTNGWGLTSAGAFVYNALGINPSLSRQHTGAWTINPINDSIKLAVMRCVYRRAVEGCMGIAPDGCPDCDRLFYAYYNIEPPLPWDNSIPYPSGPNNNPLDPSNTVTRKGIPITARSTDDENQTITSAVPSSVDNQFQGCIITVMGENGYESRVVTASKADTKMTQFTVSPPFVSELKSGVSTFDLSQTKRPPIRGIVTPECLNFDECWFCYGPTPPKRCNKCHLVGHYCGTYIWVPATGVDELTKITLLIQDIAYYDPPIVGQNLTATPNSNLGGGGGGGPTLSMGAIGPAPRRPTFYPYSGILGINQLLQTGRAAQ